MKFFKTKAVAALSLSLLLSTQVKPMGADFGIDAGDEIKLSLSEQAKQAFQSAGQKAADAASSAYQAAAPYATNALGMTVNTGKTIAANPALSAGIAAGITGAGVLAYKKPHVAGGIATAGIALGTAGLIANDNPELVKAGKDAAINAGKAVYNYAAQNAPVVYNALTNNAVTNYISQNPEIVVPAVLAGTAATYYGYTPAKNAVKAAGKKVAKTAKAVAPYAAKAAVAVSPVVAAVAVAKYSPETVEAVGNAVFNAANVVAENTPEFIKENQGLTLIGAGAAGYAASQAYAPVKRSVAKVARKAAEAAAPYADKAAQVVVNNAGKIAAAGTVAGVAGLMVYDNQEAIVAGKDAAIAMAKDTVNAIANVEYAQYSKNAVNAAKPAGAFVARQASKLKVNGARMVNAARNLDYKKMAENAGKYLADKTQAAKAMVPSVNVNSNAVIGSAAVAGSAATGYGIYKAVKAHKAKNASEVGLEDIHNLFDETVKYKTDKNTAQAIRSAAEQFKLVDQVVQSFENTPSVDSMTIIDDRSPVTEAEVKAITAILDPVEPVKSVEAVIAKVEEVTEPVKSRVTFAEPVVTEVRPFKKGSANAEPDVEVVNPINNHPVKLTQLTPAPVEVKEFAVKAPLAVNLDSETVVVQPRAALPVTVVPNGLNPAMTLLPGEDKAPMLSVYTKSGRPLPATPAPQAPAKAELPVVVVEPAAPKKAARPLPSTPAPKKAARPLPATPKKVIMNELETSEFLKPKAAVRPLPETPAQKQSAELITKAVSLGETFKLNPGQEKQIAMYVNELLDGRGDMENINKKLDDIRHTAPIKRNRGQ